eukprot:7194701-Pyramimonas_sp.AAC.1
MIMCDGGPEFEQHFGRGTEHEGILLHVVNGESPWENGKAERRGGWAKDLMLKGMEDQAVADERDLETLLHGI